MKFDELSNIVIGRAIEVHSVGFAHNPNDWCKPGFTYLHGSGKHETNAR
jgi:hypothetical protein